MKKRMVMIAGILFALAGLISIGLCIFQEGENQTLLSIGLSCNTIAFLLQGIVRRMSKEKSK